MKMMRAVGTAARTLASTAFDLVGELFERERVVELELGRDHDLVGADVLGAQVDDAHHRRGARRSLSRICATSSGAAASPTSRLAISIGEEDRDHDEQDADREAAGRVPARFVGDARPA